MKARCHDENCPFQIMYVEGQWYHTDTHGIEPDHDAAPMTYG